MDREKIILSDLDLKIMNYLREERNVTKILDEFGIGFSQCKRHIERITEFIKIRKYGTFKFITVNEKGESILELLK